MAYTATTAISGKGGVITGVPGLADIEVLNWEGTAEFTVLDATSMQSAGNYECVLGIKKVSGNMTWQGIANCTFDGASIATLALKINASVIAFTGKAYIHVAKVTVAVDGKVTYSGSFTYTGAVTLA